MKKMSLIFFLSCLQGCVQADVTEKESHNLSDNQDVIQQERERISMDFIEKSDAAIKKHKQNWLLGQYDGACEAGEVGRSVSGVTIAGFLAGLDAENYSRYRKYILSCQGSKDRQVATAAISALSDINDEDAVDLLLSNLKDDDSAIVLGALTVLDYKYKSYSGNDAKWHSYTENKIMEVCLSKEQNRHVVDYCEKNRFDKAR